MAYPFAGFGSFLFLRTEQPVWDTDTGWQPNASYSRIPVLGSDTDSSILMGYGSDDRAWEAYFSPDRLLTLRSLLGTVAILCDWTSPTPVPRNARLLTARHLSNIAAINNTPGDPTNTTQRRQRVRLEFLSQ
jgi:hypothetical protein